MSYNLIQCSCGCIYAEADGHNCNKVSDAYRIEELEAKLAEVEAERDKFHGLWKDACVRSGKNSLRADAAEARIAHLEDHIEGVTREAPDLLPCPFCGGEATHNDGGNSTYGRLWWCVGCENCDVWFADEEVWSKTKHGMLDPAYPPKHCFKVWNTRTYDFIGIMDDD